MDLSIPPLGDHERRVVEMMHGFGQRVPTHPIIPESKTLVLRARLKLEETLEFLSAAGLRLVMAIPWNQIKPDEDGKCPGVLEINLDDPFGNCDTRLAIEPRGGVAPDMEKMIDALGDDSVVNTGTFVALGVRMTPILEAIDANNLMKVSNGHIDSHGKFIKAPNHPAVNLSHLLRLQGYTPAAAPHPIVPSI